ncbi:hypothetical protein ABEB36_009243 [Hypothenemus hampei]|uniref:Uncharacterized protein n=1 Tax=Hypothenemus hampei TaxID=57062 RepID=A0ABD1EFR4_HYPHA
MDITSRNAPKDPRHTTIKLGDRDKRSPKDPNPKRVRTSGRWTTTKNWSSRTPKGIPGRSKIKVLATVNSSSTISTVAQDLRERKNDDKKKKKYTKPHSSDHISPSTTRNHEGKIGTMGNNQAKQEEVIIAQTGNSGPQVVSPKFGSVQDIMGIITILLVLAIIIYVLIRCLKNDLNKKIRKEVSRSVEKL